MLATTPARYGHPVTQKHANFHGPRDFFSLVAYCAAKLAACEHGLHEDRRRILEMGIRRNFGGLPEETDNILRLFLTYDGAAAATTCKGSSADAAGPAGAWYARQVLLQEARLLCEAGADACGSPGPCS